MKQKNIFATWLRYITDRKVVENDIFINFTLPINLCFIQTMLIFLLYHMQKELF